ncbi:UbiH/UbiF/VisC/COQ6 family ubiquinone biosynthesis hydroxylase [Methylophaga sp.]|uniref:UbiH/UbiF/VisC/COQ6 family ubiquinone biosynthesis hydroxylase n=1 Tax=Methylophaga sp. TaxID=2024840 RepID=UPI003F6A1241
MNAQFDIAIVGGGMVGATLALALSKHADFRIALIEAHTPTQLNVDASYELRVSALTRSSESILQNLGVWQYLPEKRLSAFTDMKVWESADSEIHFNSADMGEPWLGHLLENRVLQQTCLDLCKKTANIDVISPASPLSYEPFRLELDNGQHINAKLIIAADGAHSALRQWAKIPFKGWSYQQKGLVCTVTTEHSHQHTAWQRFLTEGPLAFLPLADEHQSSIVWSLNTDSADRLMDLPETEFIEALNAAYEEKLGKVTAISERAAFPLQLQHAATYIQPGFALVGDAAHTIHPLAGQGVNIGLLDAATLSEVVINAAVHGRDIGSLHTLQKYQRQRRADNVLMQLSMDMFKRVFSNQIGPLRWLRKTGLKSVNQNAWLKNLFMHQAASRVFAQPSLSKRPISD